MKVSILFPSFNRKEFTQVALETLIENTDPNLVDRVFIVDGSSEDGVTEYLQQMVLKTSRLNLQLRSIKERHVVAAMLTAARELPNKWLAKIDSDTVVPKGWLDECLATVSRHPRLWALGIEPFTPFRDVEPGTRGFREARFVGGIGLFRKDAWSTIRASKPPFFGWTEHQERNSWTKGWLDPPIPTILLDRLPFEPFRSLSETYSEKKWQRTWSPYPLTHARRWEWKFPDWKEAECQQSS